MKKLISIKSDESGENIYFTHKNGVDSVRKDDVVDVELLNPYKIFRTQTDGFNIYSQILAFIFTLTMIHSFFISGKGEDKVIKIIVLTLTLLLVWSMGRLLLDNSTRNSRRILKLYTLRGVVQYRLSEDWQIYYGLYDHFKQMLSKYFPQKGDTILYNINPSNRNYHKVMTFVIPIFIVLIILSSIKFYSTDFARFGFSVGFSILLIFSTIVNYFRGYGQWITYTFQGNHLVKKYSFSVKSEEMEDQEDLNKIILVKNKENIAVIPKLYTGNMPDYLVENTNSDSENLINAIVRITKFQGREIEEYDEYIKFYNGKNGDLYHNLKVAQDYRDITPIIVKYINDLSDEQSYDE